MEIISRLLGPIVAVIFGKEGLSSSEANAQKNANTEKSRALVKEIDEATMVYTKSIVWRSGSENVTERTDQTEYTILNPESLYQKLEGASVLNGDSAILGFGIKMKDGLRDRVMALTSVQIAELFGREDEFYPTPTLQSPVLKCAMYARLPNQVEVLISSTKTAEALIQLCNHDVITKVGRDVIVNALRDESRAAVFGKTLNQQDGFFQRLFRTKGIESLPSNTTDGLIIERTSVRLYDATQVDAFRTKFEQLQTQHYQPAQSRCNGSMKLIRDAIREVQMEYNKEYTEALNAYQAEQEKIKQLSAQADSFAQEMKTLALKELADAKILV